MCDIHIHKEKRRRHLHSDGSSFFIFKYERNNYLNFYSSVALGVDVAPSNFCTLELILAKIPGVDLSSFEKMFMISSNFSS